MSTRRNLADLAPHRGVHLGLYLAGHDVPDPWGNGPEAFSAVAALIEDGAGAAAHL